MEQFCLQDERFMALALDMAMKGWGGTNPNPLVGAVVVKDGNIIGQGWHRRSGGMHAERDVLSAMGDEARGAVLYVNLEPCCFYGRTPPCVSVIKEKGIARVVAAMKDPNPKVNGNGIKMLNEAGIQVTVGVLEGRAKKLNEIFIKYITSDMPFVILKSAMTLDGKTAAASGDSFWVSGEEARQEVQTLRRRVASIMVGVNTVIKDNPKLTVRALADGDRKPVRIVVDSAGRVPIDSSLINTANEVPTLIATTGRMSADCERTLLDKGAKVVRLPAEQGRVDIKALLRHLRTIELDSVFLEGGGYLNASAVSAGVVDKIVIYIAPKILGGDGAHTPIAGAGIDIMADAILVRSMTVRKVGQDLCVEGYPARKSETPAVESGSAGAGAIGSGGTPEPSPCSGFGVGWKG